MNFFKKIAEHLFGHFKIGNHARDKGSRGDNVSRGTPDHFFRLTANSQDLAGFLIDRNDRRLVNHDSPAFDVNQCIGRSQINPNIF